MSMLPMPRKMARTRKIDIFLSAKKTGLNVYEVTVSIPQVADASQFKAVVDRVRECLAEVDRLELDEVNFKMMITTDYPEVRARCLLFNGIQVNMQ